MSQWQNWLNSVDGVAIDVDGNWGPQCWDLWSHYAMNNFGCSMWATSTNAGGTYHHPGYTCEIWHNFSTGPLGQWFTPHNGTPQRGDVALWEWGSAVGPQSHVAIVVEDRGGSILCMTQNPGPSHYGNLSKAGILGYLRPDNQSIFDGDAPAPAPAPTPGGQIYVIQPGDTLWGVSERFYGTGTRYMEIFNASSFRSGNPSLIFPGEVANIP